MIRLPLNLITLLAVVGGSLAAQDTTTIRVFTEPAGIRFLVDGQYYFSAQTFTWPKGSKHVIQMLAPVLAVPGTNPNCPDEGSVGQPVQYESSCRSRYQLSGWETGGGQLNTSGSTQVITADPSVGFVKALFNVEHLIDVVFFEGATVYGTSPCFSRGGPLGQQPPGAGPGVVFVGGECLPASKKLWLAPGEYALQAVPYDGYVFTGWYTDNGQVSPSISVFDVKGPAVLNPRFEPGKRVRLYTNPKELQVLVDRTPITTIDPARFIVTLPVPGYFDWAAGSKHILGAPTPQIDLGGLNWVFDSWSNGGGQNMEFITRDTNIAQDLTAKFVRGAPVTFLTSPAGLKLNVDGSITSTLNYIWGVGHKHTVAAPAEQTDSTGRKYVFASWADGSTDRTKEVTVTDAMLNGGTAFAATFERLSQITFMSSIPGMVIKVDGADCRTPCRLDRAKGTQVRIQVPQSMSLSPVSRQELIGWGDSNASERVFTLDQDLTTATVRYRVYNRLLGVVDPEEGAVLQISPASPDGFYPDNTSVAINVETKPGFKFRRWDGDATGTANQISVPMSASRVVRALLEKVPYVEPAGVRNAAGETPEPGVAPGSLISIYGGSLAREYEAGTSNPLPQTLGGVVVQVEDRLLPMVFVSPDQINAQLPSDLAPGRYTLTVRGEGAADIAASFEIVRNAPGIFSNVVGDKTWALALHEDGTPVTATSPARRDETITILGTGFGPYARRVLDAFRVPASPLTDVADNVDLLIGSQTWVKPLWAGAAPGYVGVNAVRVRITNQFTPGSTLEVRISVNSKLSNSVLLAVE